MQQFLGTLQQFCVYFSTENDFVKLYFVTQSPRCENRTRFKIETDTWTHGATVSHFFKSRGASSWSDQFPHDEMMRDDEGQAACSAALIITFVDAGVTAYCFRWNVCLRILLESAESCPAFLVTLLCQLQQDHANFGALAGARLPSIAVGLPRAPHSPLRHAPIPLRIRAHCSGTGGRI